MAPRGVIVIMAAETAHYLIIPHLPLLPSNAVAWSSTSSIELNYLVAPSVKRTYILIFKCLSFQGPIAAGGGYCYVRSNIRILQLLNKKFNSLGLSS